MAGSDFRLLVGAAKAPMVAQDADAAADLYDSLEETGGGVLVLSGKEERVFNAFCRAIDWVLKDPRVVSHLHHSVPSELVTKLRADSRYRG